MTRMWFHIESNKQELAHEVKPSVIFTEIWWKMANFITQKSMHFNEQHSDWHDLELRDGGRGRDWCCRKLPPSPPPRAPSSSSPSSTKEGISTVLQNVTEMRLPLRNQYRETWGRELRDSARWWTPARCSFLQLIWKIGNKLCLNQINKYSNVM